MFAFLNYRLTNGKANVFDHSQTFSVGFNDWPKTDRNGL